MERQMVQPGPHPVVTTGNKRRPGLQHHIRTAQLPALPSRPPVHTPVPQLAEQPRPLPLRHRDVLHPQLHVMQQPHFGHTAILRDQTRPGPPPDGERQRVRARWWGWVVRVAGVPVPRRLDGTSPWWWPQGSATPLRALAPTTTTRSGPRRAEGRGHQLHPRSDHPPALPPAPGGRPPTPRGSAPHPDLGQETPGNRPPAPPSGARFRCSGALLA